MYELRIHVKHVVLYSKPSTMYFYIHKMNRIVPNRLYLPPTRVVVFLFVQYYAHKTWWTSSSCWTVSRSVRQYGFPRYHSFSQEVTYIILDVYMYVRTCKNTERRRRVLCYDTSPTRYWSRRDLLSFYREAIIWFIDMLFDYWDSKSFLCWSRHNNSKAMYGFIKWRMKKMAIICLK